MDVATGRVADYIDRLGIKLTTMSKGTGISDGILRRSLTSKERDLRADEFLVICRFLNVDPFTFYEARHEKGGQYEDRDANP